MRKNGWMGFVAVVVLSLSLAACKDTKTLQENEQLKTQVAELQKENGQLGNDLQEAKASSDALAKENAALKAQMKPSKKKSTGKKSSRRKRR
jgi:outer membrane murein-binding lipoprotein Lpp